MASTVAPEEIDAISVQIVSATPSSLQQTPLLISRSAAPSSLVEMIRASQEVVKTVRGSIRSSHCCLPRECRSRATADLLQARTTSNHITFPPSVTRRASYSCLIVPIDISTFAVTACRSYMVRVGGGVTINWTIQVSFRDTIMINTLCGAQILCNDR